MAFIKKEFVQLLQALLQSLQLILQVIKKKQKILLGAAEIPVPKGIIIYSEEDCTRCIDQLVIRW